MKSKSNKYRNAFHISSPKWRPICPGFSVLWAILQGWVLTHWGRVTHICVSKLTTIGSDNGLSPGRRQAIIWTNAGIMIIGPLGTNFSEIFIEIYTFSFKKMHLKMLSGKWQSSCLGLNVLISQFPLFSYFPNFSALSQHTLAIEHDIYIWQVSLHLSWGNTLQITIWFK